MTTPDAGDTEATGTEATGTEATGTEATGTEGVLEEPEDLSPRDSLTDDSDDEDVPPAEPEDEPENSHLVVEEPLPPPPLVVELSSDELGALRDEERDPVLAAELVGLGLIDDHGVVGHDATAMLDALDRPDVMVTTETRDGDAIDARVIVANQSLGVEWSKPLDGVHRLETIALIDVPTRILHAAHLEARPDAAGASRTCATTPPGDLVSLVGDAAAATRAFGDDDPHLVAALVDGRITEVVISPAGTSDEDEVAAEVVLWLDALDGGLWLVEDAPAAGQGSDEAGGTTLRPSTTPEISRLIWDALPEAVAPAHPTHRRD